MARPTADPRPDRQVCRRQAGQLGRTRSERIAPADHAKARPSAAEDGDVSALVGAMYGHSGAAQAVHEHLVGMAVVVAGAN